MELRTQRSSAGQFYAMLGPILVTIFVSGISEDTYNQTSNNYNLWFQYCDFMVGA